MILDEELVIEIGDVRTFRDAPGAAKELLAIGDDGGGIRHAIYPTASRTLCSRTDDGLEVSGDDRPPNCLACATAAAAFDRIDRSAPSTWFRHAEEADAA